MMALVVKAQQAAEDITYELMNANFETGDGSGWTNPSGIGFGIMGTAVANNYEGTYFMEAWVGSGSNLGDFVWEQAIEVPNGYYAVKALAHAIKQNQTVTPEPKGIYVFAEDQKVQVTTTVRGDYVVIAKVTDGELNVGYCGESCNVNWVAVDDFKVFQCFGDTEAAARISWMKGEMYLLAEEFEYLTEVPMSAALVKEMKAAVASIEDVADVAAAEALYNTMKVQYEDAQACVTAYDQLMLQIEKAYAACDEYGEYEGDLMAYAVAAQAKYEDGEYTTEEAVAEYAALGQAIIDFEMSFLEGDTGIDVTETYVKNPSVRTKAATEGWTITVTNNANAMPAWGHDCIEFWSCDFNMSQTLTDLPNGKYVVKLQGFYREAGNDGGSRHAAGTEEITAELFANNNSVKFTSIYAYTAAEMGVTVNLNQGYVDGLQSAGIAFSTENPLTGKYYYADNELTVIVTDGTLTFGARNASNVGNRWCIFRDFQLFYYGNFPGVNLYGKMEDIKAYMANNPGAIPYAVQKQLEAYMDEKLDYTIQDAYEDAEVNAVLFELDEMWAEALKAAELLKSLQATADKIQNELFALDYPGKSELDAALIALEPYFDAASTVNTYEGLLAIEAEVNAAIRAYYMSQVATPETAADYTVFLPNPNFEVKGDWTWEVVGSGRDQWSGGCRPTSEGGASRQGVNLWGWGITSIDVHQVLTDLPDGLYKVSAELITQTGYATDQHVYASSANRVVSENLAVEGWDTYEWAELVTTDFAVVVGGRLTVGAESSMGGSNSEGWFQATNFQLRYHGPATAEQLKAAWESTEARANEALEILLASDKGELVAAMAEAAALAAEEKYGDACAKVFPLLDEMNPVITTTKNFYGGYYAKLDTIRQYDAYDGCEMVYSFADAAIALADAILTADTTTNVVFTELDNILHAYANYAAALRDAENAMKDETAGYEEKYITYFKEQVINPQVEALTAEFSTVEYCDEQTTILKKATSQFTQSVNINREIEEGDVTYLISNPTIDVVEGEDLEGWVVLKNNAQNCGTNKGEHYSGVASDTYLDAWHPSTGVMNATFYQELLGIPDGTYKLTVAARTDGENVNIFAATAYDIADESTLFVPVTNNGAFRGGIWMADSLAWEAAGAPADDLDQVKKDFPCFMARPDSTGFGEGYGWNWIVVENIEVTEHYLCIGITADSELTGANFTAYWMGADDWKLELVKKSETQSEFNPFAEVENIEVATPELKVIYDLFGRRIDAVTTSGIYIINGKKVLIKK